MQGERHGLAVGQRAAKVGVHRIDQGLAFRVFVGIQRTDLRLQRIFDGLALLRAANRATDVVGKRYDKRRLPVGLITETDAVHGIGDQSDDLRRDSGHLLRHVVGIAAVRGNEPADDLRFVNMLSGLGLEADAASGEDHLTIAVFRQNDVVVEHTKNVHAGSPLDNRWVSAECRSPRRRP